MFRFTEADAHGNRLGSRYAPVVDRVIEAYCSGWSDESLSALHDAMSMPGIDYCRVFDLLSEMNLTWVRFAHDREPVRSGFQVLPYPSIRPGMGLPDVFGYLHKTYDRLRHQRLNQAVAALRGQDVPSMGQIAARVRAADLVAASSHASVYCASDDDGPQCLPSPSKKARGPGPLCGSEECASAHSGASAHQQAAVQSGTAGPWGQVVHPGAAGHQMAAALPAAVGHQMAAAPPSQ